MLDLLPLRGYKFQRLHHETSTKLTSTPYINNCYWLRVTNINKILSIHIACRPALQFAYPDFD